MKGRGEEMKHQKGREEPEQTEMHMDFCFPGEETNDKKLTVMVVRERRTRMTVSTVVPNKSNGEFMAKRVLAFMREIGADKGDMTDQEPSMKVIVNEVARHRSAAGTGAQPGWGQQGQRHRRAGHQERGCTGPFGMESPGGPDQGLAGARSSGVPVDGGARVRDVIGARSARTV